MRKRNLTIERPKEEVPEPERKCTVKLVEIRDRVNRRTQYIKDNPSQWRLVEFLEKRDVKKQDQKWVIGFNGKTTTFSELKKQLNDRCDTLGGEGEIFVGSKFSYYYLANQEKYITNN